MANSKPLPLEYVVGIFANFAAERLRLTEPVRVSHGSYRLQPAPGFGYDLSEFVFDLQAHASKLCMSGEYATARFIKMRGGIVYSGNLIYPASIVISDEDRRILLTIEGRNEDELRQNLERCAKSFCCPPSSSSDPQSWTELLKQLVLSVKNSSVNESDERGKTTRELLSGILYEFQVACKPND